MVQQLLLAGQLIVVILIYLFVWRVMRSAVRDVRAGGEARGRSAAAAVAGAQDSTIIPAADVARARHAAGLREARIIVVSSDVLRPGVPYTIANGLTLGRTSANDIVLDDGHVSGAHARIVTPNTLVDLNSTNGTTVNGRPVSGRAALRDGDQFTVGTTTFRFEGTP